MSHTILLYYCRGLVLIHGISQGWSLGVRASSEAKVGQEEVLASLLPEEEICLTHSHMHTYRHTCGHFLPSTCIHMCSMTVHVNCTKCSFTLIGEHPCIPISNSWLSSQIQIWFSSQRALLLDNLCLWNKVHAVLWLNLSSEISCCNESPRFGLLGLPFLTVLTDVLPLLSFFAFGSNDLFRVLKDR